MQGLWGKGGRFLLFPSLTPETSAKGICRIRPIPGVSFFIDSLTMRLEG